MHGGNPYSPNYEGVAHRRRVRGSMESVYAGYSLLGALSILPKRNRCRLLGTDCARCINLQRNAARANFTGCILVRHAPRQKVLLLQLMPCPRLV